MPADDRTLFKMAQKLRRICLESTAEAASGHPTSCMSAADIVATLFFEEMRFDPRDPTGKDADVFVLSKGHAAPLLWAALREAGALSADPNTLRSEAEEGQTQRRRLWSFGCWAQWRHGRGTDNSTSGHANSALCWRFSR